MFLKLRKCILKSLNQKILQELSLTHCNFTFNQEDALTITHTLFSHNAEVKSYVTKKINELFISLKRKLINSAKYIMMLSKGSMGQLCASFSWRVDNDLPKWMWLTCLGMWVKLRKNLSDWSMKSRRKRGSLCRRKGGLKMWGCSGKILKDPMTSSTIYRSVRNLRRIIHRQLYVKSKS